MKIVCLTRGRPRHHFFVNEIHKHHPVSLLVVETPSSKNKLSRNIKEKGLIGFARMAFKHFLANGRETDILNQTFGDRWKSVATEIEVQQTENINDALVLDRLRKLQPDLILDHGTSIVKHELLETAPMALNLHWGLSPYYRGTSCTEWALMNRDPHNIGVTIHKLSRHIDGGSILSQRRVEVLPEDTVDSINCRLTLNGTELVIDAINRLKSGENLEFADQELSRGFLYLNQHVDERFRQSIRRLEKNGGIAAMLKKPARKEKVPIVEVSPLSR